jgi:hypothetical protein
MDTTVLLAGISALAGVVTYLWKQITDHHKETREARADCEADRERLWKALYAIHPASKELKDL